MFFKLGSPVLVLLLFCAGCSSLDIRIDQSYRSVQSDNEGLNTAISAIEVAYSPDGERFVNSVARAGGGKPALVDVDTLKTYRTVIAGRFEMHLKLLYGNDDADEKEGSFDGEWEKYGSAAIEAVEKSISTFDTVQNKKFVINLVSSPDDRPIYVVSASDVDSAEVSLVIYAGHPAYLADAARWWAGTTETIAHELMHLQHQLSSAVSYKPSVESEFAGTVVGKCGYLKYLIEIGDREVDFEFSRSSIQDQIFPALHSEQFQYNKEKLNRLGSFNEIADVLGSAYSLHLLGEQPTRLDGLSVVKPLFDYCDSLYNRIPRISEL